MIPESTPEESIVERAVTTTPDRELSDAAAARRQAFIDAGREAFFAKGYAGTTMSSIAAAVGGSKTTLWTYFPSKEDLFAAVLDDLAEQYCEALTVDLPPDAPLEPTLRRFLEALMRTILSEPIIELQRLVIGEATRFPHLAKMFFDRAPGPGRARVAAYLGAAMERGELRAGDPSRAVLELKALVSSGLHLFQLHNLPCDCSEAVIAREIDAALDSFLRAWRA
jgi:AcrR family transcriptional regulator